MWREEPATFAKLYAGIMPKEFWVDSVASELTDDELYQMLESLRQQLATSDKRHFPAPSKSGKHLSFYQPLKYPPLAQIRSYVALAAAVRCSVSNTVPTRGLNARYE
jgi:hypothetical protein